MAQGFTKQQPLDTDPTLSSNSDYISASQKAVKAYVDNNIGSGDVTGDSSSTDNAIARFDGASGKQIQNSSVAVDDDGNITNINALQFDITPTITLHSEGQFHWNVDEETFDADLGNDVSYQLGDELYTGLVINQTGDTLSNGKVAKYAGAVGASGKMKADYMIADGSDMAKLMLGIFTEDITDGNTGRITAWGKVRGIDTTGGAESWAEGDILYVSPTTAGDLTNVAPSPPELRLPIAVVISVHAVTGTIFVRAINHGYELADLHDVDIASLVDREVLTWDSAAGTWINDSIQAEDVGIADAGGYFTGTDVEAALQAYGNQRRDTTIEGLQLIYNSAASVSVGVGSCFAENGDFIKVTSTLTASSLSLTINTWYHLYLYLSSGTPALEVVTTAPVAWKGTAYSKTSDTSRRYVGSIRAYASNSMIPFYHHPTSNFIEYSILADTYLRVLTNGTAQPSQTYVSCSIAVPAIGRVNVLMRVTSLSATQSAYMGNDLASNIMTVGNTSSGYSHFFTNWVLDTSQQFSYYHPATGGSLYVDIYGYFLNR